MKLKRQNHERFVAIMCRFCCGSRLYDAGVQGDETRGIRWMTFVAVCNGKSVICLTGLLNRGGFAKVPHFGALPHGVL